MNSDRSIIQFAGFTLDRANQRLTRGSDPVPLQPQPLKVLMLLAARAGELVTRKELQDAVWGSDTYVDFDQGLNWCIRRIREVLGDDATAPRFIETVPRLGYRFVAKAIVPAGRRRRFTFLMAAALVTGCVAMGAATHMLRLTRTVTVVVLPFDNFTGDAKNEVVADLTTEEIINRIGSIDPDRIRVIDRATATKFKRKNECIIHIGEQLGAAFVMEGSVQKHRTTAALYRVSDNTQVWATAIEPRVDLAPAAISARVGATFR